MDNQKPVLDGDWKSPDCRTMTPRAHQAVTAVDRPRTKSEIAKEREAALDKEAMELVVQDYLTPDPLSRWARFRLSFNEWQRRGRLSTVQTLNVGQRKRGAPEDPWSAASLSRTLCLGGEGSRISTACGKPKEGKAGVLLSDVVLAKASAILEVNKEWMLSGSAEYGWPVWLLQGCMRSRCFIQQLIIYQALRYAVIDGDIKRWTEITRPYEYPGSVEIMRRMISGPLGMSATFFVDEELFTRVAGYLKNNKINIQEYLERYQQDMVEAYVVARSYYHVESIETYRQALNFPMSIAGDIRQKFPGPVDATQIIWETDPPSTPKDVADRLRKKYEENNKRRHAERMTVGFPAVKGQ